MDINQLSPDLMPQLNDLVPMWSTSQGLPRKTPLSAIAAAILATVTLPGGVISAATTAILNGTASAPNVGTALAALNPFNAGGLSWPAQSSASAFAYDAVNGNFVAQRDVKLAEFKVALNASWTNAVLLQLAVLVGPDATPYTLTPQASFLGAGAVRSLSFSGYAMNPNNLNAVIKAGDKLKLAASLGTAGVLTIASVQFAVQSLDGV